MDWPVLGIKPLLCTRVEQFNPSMLMAVNSLLQWCKISGTDSRKIQMSDSGPDSNSSRKSTDSIPNPIPAPKTKFSDSYSGSHSSAFWNLWLQFQFQEKQGLIRFRNRNSASLVCSKINMFYSSINQQENIFSMKQPDMVRNVHFTFSVGTDKGNWLCTLHFSLSSMTQNVYSLHFSCFCQTSFVVSVTFNHLLFVFTMKFKGTRNSQYFLWPYPYR